MRERSVSSFRGAGLLNRRGGGVDAAEERRRGEGDGGLKGFQQRWEYEPDLKFTIFYENLVDFFKT